MKNKNLYSVPLFLIFTAAATAQHSNCSHGDAPNAGQTAGAPTVQIPRTAAKNINLQTSPAAERMIYDSITAIGQAENIPQNVEAVSSRIGGRAMELYVSPDSRIAKGEPIAKIESLVFGNPPPTITIFAPRSGVVEKLYITKGSPVTPDNPLATIADTSKIYVVANIFEPSVSRLKAGQTAEIKFESFPDKIFTGRLVKFSSALAPDTSTLGAYFEVENPGGQIKPGMRAVFRIITGESPAKASVPQSAVLGEHGNHFVYVQKCATDMVYERRYVAVGKSDGRYVEILEGVRPGEIVAVQGVYQLQFMPAAESENGHSANAKTSVETEKNPPADKKSYIGNLMWSALCASLFLNAIFILGQFRKRKDGGL